MDRGTIALEGPSAAVRDDPALAALSSAVTHAFANTQTETEESSMAVQLPTPTQLRDIADEIGLSISPMPTSRRSSG